MGVVILTANTTVRIYQKTVREQGLESRQICRNRHIVLQKVVGNCIKEVHVKVLLLLHVLKGIMWRLEKIIGYEFTIRTVLIALYLIFIIYIANFVHIKFVLHVCLPSSFTVYTLLNSLRTPASDISLLLGHNVL